MERVKQSNDLQPAQHSRDYCAYGDSYAAVDLLPRGEGRDRKRLSERN